MADGEQVVGFRGDCFVVCVCVCVRTQRTGTQSCAAVRRRINRGDGLLGGVM